jgi:hypothetical protein
MLKSWSRLECSGDLPVIDNSEYYAEKPVLETRPNTHTEQHEMEVLRGNLFFLSFASFYSVVTVHAPCIVTHSSMMEGYWEQ